MNPQLQMMLQQALQSFQSGNYERADSILVKIIKADSKNLPALHVLGLIKASQKKYQEAADLLSRAARLNPNEPSIQYNLAKSLADCGSFRESIPHHKKAVELMPNNPEALLNYGIALSALKNFEESLQIFDRAITLQPRYAEAALNRGLTLKELNRSEEALISFNNAISLNPESHESWFNKGSILNDIKRYDQAIEAFEEAILLNPDHYQTWFNKGIALEKVLMLDQAISAYDQALKLNSECYDAWLNKGVTLHELKRYSEAIDAYERVIKYKPENFLAWFNKGVSFRALGNFDQALISYEKSTELNPDYLDSWINKGIIFQELKRYDEAVSSYQYVLELSPDVDWIRGDLLHIKMKMCSWKSFEKDANYLIDGVRSNKKITHPFPFLSLVDDGNLQRQCAEIYCQTQFPFNLKLGPITKLEKNKKIRVGYFSGDLRNHPVSFLTAELFELHDKNQFEIIAFSCGVNDHSPMRHRLSQAFDQFFDVSERSDEDIAQLARNEGIDIAVDLGGYTAENRPGVFAYRSAPIQVGYIGYLGTLGANYVDYLLADKTIIPPGAEKYYSEKIAFLPSYQANDSYRKIPEHTLTRESLGLPKSAFVYACFNSNAKISPSTFDGWMRILKGAENSVLFLYAENMWAADNLKKEAEARGVSRHRLIFGEHLSSDQYLARYRACDLFLDTHPYNAGTTASDALWAGLPVLTLIGQSFPSRVAASILSAIGLDELVTQSQGEYEAKAIELARHPETIVEIRKKLADNIFSTMLFDTSRFTKSIEAIYLEMYYRHHADLEPDHINIF